MATRPIHSNEDMKLNHRAIKGTRGHPRCAQHAARIETSFTTNPRAHTPVVDTECMCYNSMSTACNDA